VKIAVSQGASQGASQGRSFLARAFDLASPGVAPPLNINAHFFGGCYVSAHNYREYLENGKLHELDDSFLKM